jgi:hypothetical protein
VGVWESAEQLQLRWAGKKFETALVSVGFPSPSTADTTVLTLHATEPPL